MPSEAGLSVEFFCQDTVSIARHLIGCRLVSTIGGVESGGIIVETEAYTQEDPACHAFNGPTPRNRSMFGPPGRLYVYLIYGLHHCANVVTEPEGRGCAVLIRAIHPELGMDVIRQRRVRASKRSLTDGPGKLCQALGIDRVHDGVNLLDPASAVVLRPRVAATPPAITATARIGISQNIGVKWRFVTNAPGGG